MDLIAFLRDCQLDQKGSKIHSQVLRVEGLTDILQKRAQCMTIGSTFMLAFTQPLADLCALPL